MLLLAKIALGVTGGLTLAAGYTFHEGMVRVSVDEHGPKGDHVHLMVPAALIRQPYTWRRAVHSKTLLARLARGCRRFGRLPRNSETTPMLNWSRSSTRRNM